MDMFLRGKVGIDRVFPRVFLVSSSGTVHSTRDLVPQIRIHNTTTLVIFLLFTPLPQFLQAVASLASLPGFGFPPSFLSTLFSFPTSSSGLAVAGYSLPSFSSTSAAVSGS